MKTFSSDRRKIKESISTLSDLNVHANRPLIKNVCWGSFHSREFRRLLLFSFNLMVFVWDYTRSCPLLSCRQMKNLCFLGKRSVSAEQSRFTVLFYDETFSVFNTS